MIQIEITLVLQDFILFLSIFTARKQSLRQGNVFTPVCDSVHGGGSAPLHAGIHPLGRHPLDRHPLGRHPQADTPRQTPPGQTPPRQTPPWADTLPGHTAP